MFLDFLLMSLIYFSSGVQKPKMPLTFICTNHEATQHRESRLFMLDKDINFLKEWEPQYPWEIGSTSAERVKQVTTGLDFWTDL